MQPKQQERIDEGPFTDSLGRQNGKQIDEQDFR
jgi:hypothetical protein